MAPSVNLSDDVAELSRAVAQLFRLALAGQSPARLGKAAAAAGLSAAMAQQFMAGLVVLPPRQGVVFANAVLDEARGRQAGYLATIRRSIPVAASEASREGAEAAAAQLGQDFPAWRFGLPDEAAGGKLTWHAEHAGDWPDVYAVSAAELRGKLEGVERALSENKRAGGRLIPTGKAS